MSEEELIRAAKELYDNCNNTEECPLCPFYSDVMGCLFDGIPEGWRVGDI